MSQIISSVSSREPKGKHSRRWLELDIYAEDAGGFTVVTRGHSAIPGEQTREARIPCVDVDAVFEALHFNGRLSDTATRALEMAAKADTSFAEALGDRHEVEDLDRLPATVSGFASPDYGPVVIERDGDRALRFLGKRIGYARSMSTGDSHLEVSIFSTAGGRYVVQKAQVAGEDRANPIRSTVSVVGDASSALDVLVRRSTGWVETQVIDALRQAATNDRRFALSLGDRLDQRVRSVRQLVEDVPRIGESLKKILRALAAGDLLVEELRTGEGAGVRWHQGRDGLPRVPRPVFITLCRRRLLQLHRRVSVDEQIWTISKLGIAALTSSQILNEKA